MFSAHVVINIIISNIVIFKKQNLNFKKNAKRKILIFNF